MNVAFRVDASNAIGTGHLWRCLSLADALARKGARTRFISRHMPEYLMTVLDAKGHGIAQLNETPNEEGAAGGAYAHWLGVSQAQDARGTRQALSDYLWDWLIVDHYALDLRWETVLRASAKRILAIDDIADRKHDCDVLLDQNLYRDMNRRYTRRVPGHCRLLLGPRYALLREEFSEIHERVRPRTTPIRRVLVFFGGVDAVNCTGRALDSLAGFRSHRWHVDVVIGAQHPFGELIVSACVDQGYSCHVQTNRMAELMAMADLAIGAAGSASWERCCVGLPALVVSLADNQVEIAREIARQGAAVYVGSSEQVSATDLCASIMRLTNADSTLEALSRRSYSLVDGRGVERMCQEMVC